MKNKELEIRKLRTEFVNYKLPTFLFLISISLFLIPHV